MVAPNSAWRAGSARFTTEPSMNTMLDPRIVAKRIHRACIGPHWRAHRPERIWPSSHGCRSAVANPSPHIESAASPGLRHREHDERKWIPVGPEGRSLVPRHYDAHDTHGKANRAKHQGVPHGPIGREPRCDVAPHDAVESAISRRKQEGRVGHRPAPRRENADYV